MAFWRKLAPPLGSWVPRKVPGRWWNASVASERFSGKGPCSVVAFLDNVGQRETASSRRRALSFSVFSHSSSGLVCISSLATAQAWGGIWPRRLACGCPAVAMSSSFLILSASTAMGARRRQGGGYMPLGREAASWGRADVLAFSVFLPPPLQIPTAWR